MTHQLNIAELIPAVAAEPIEVRLAASEAEIEAAQRLRYQVFYEEMGAKPCPQTACTRIDRDYFDAVCDHLLAIAGGEVVGTYRLIRRKAAEEAGGFYSAGEYDIAPVLAYPGEVLELGRSCIDARWRNRGALQLLWQGLSAYIVENDISLLFGCASLPGTDPQALASQLAYLRDNHLAPPELRATAHDCHRVDAPAVAVPFDGRRTFQSLPPLLKGYLRAGAVIGDGAVIDHQFNTTDVFVALKTDAIAARYRRRYETSGVLP